MILLALAPAGAPAGTVVIDPAAAYPEGPLWRDGKLLYVEYAGPGVKIWDGKKFAIFWSGPHCGASGLIGFGRDHLLVACYDANSIVELDASGKTVRTIDRDSAGKPFVGPNDFAADGNYYIAQNGSGRVLVVDDARKLKRIVTVPTRSVTNVNFGADGAHTLYITGVFDQFKPPYAGAVYRVTP